ncbi:MAG: hypothetical protein ACKVOA_03045 [Methylophilaceae bacterium]
MKIWLSIWLLCLALLIAGAWWWHLNDEVDDNQLQKTVLQEDIYACDAITEKAAANLVAIVEEQKLEIAGRKAHVFKLCMKDHGYIENPAWTKYSAPIAENVAKQTNVSVDEAIENLRRVNMMQFNAEKGAPLFWTKAATAN